METSNNNQHTLQTTVVVTLTVMTVVILGATAFMYSKKTTSQKVTVNPNTLQTKREKPSEEKLAELTKSYKANFRPGCALEEKTDFKITSTTTLSLYLAKCSVEHPTHKYSVGVFMGHPALIEEDTLSKFKTPIITFVSSVTDTSDIGKIQSLSSASQEFKNYLAHSLDKNAERYKEADVSYKIIDNQVLMYLVPMRNGIPLLYFDRTYLTLSQKK